MDTWTIYMYTFPNGKRYIGKTKRRLSQRQGNTSTLSGYRRCTLLWKAIQKYGVSSIKQDVLICEPMSSERANELEMHYIDTYKTNIKKYGTRYGYNMTAGGDGVTDIHYSDEEKQRHIEQMRQNGLKHKGVPLFEEHKMKLSNAKKKERHPMFGKHHSDDVKAKIGKANSRENMSEETRRRRSNSKKKLIIANRIDGEHIILFECISEAACYFHVQPSAVTRWCNKTRKPSIPYTFNYYSPTTTERERRKSACNSLSSDDTTIKKSEKEAQGYPDPFGSSFLAC